MTKLLIPPPPTPAIDRKTYNCTGVFAKPHARSPTPIRNRHSKSIFFRPKISESRPLISWKAVDAIKNEVPIHDVEVPVSSSPATAGVAVDTLVWSRKDTKRHTDRAVMEIRRRFRGRSLLRWPPMLSASLWSVLFCSAICVLEPLSMLAIRIFSSPAS